MDALSRRRRAVIGLCLGLVAGGALLAYALDDPEGRREAEQKARTAAIAASVDSLNCAVAKLSAANREARKTVDEIAREMALGIYQPLDMDKIC